MTRVSYEITFGMTAAAYQRFGRAILECRAQAIDTASIGETAIALVKLSPGLEENFRATCKPWEMKYRSPTVFDNGTLVSKFASPEDEVAGHVRPEAQRVIDKCRK